MVELSTWKREIRWDEGNHHEKLGIGGFRVQVNGPSPIRHVQVVIRRLIAPIRGILNSIREVLPLMSHCRSYPPYRSHHHPPSLSLSSPTIPSLQEHKVKSSLSISPCHHHESTLSAVYTECSIHWVQHTLHTASSEYSMHRVQHTPRIVRPPFILSISCWPLNIASASGVPPNRSTATSPSSISASKVKSPRHIFTVSSSLTDD